MIALYLPTAASASCAGRSQLLSAMPCGPSRDEPNVAIALALRLSVLRARHRWRAWWDDIGRWIGLMVDDDLLHRLAIVGPSAITEAILPRSPRSAPDLTGIIRGIVGQHGGDDLAGAGIYRRWSLRHDRRVRSCFSSSHSPWPNSFRPVLSITRCSGPLGTILGYRPAKRLLRRVFVPLAHPPGHAQVDFGEAVAVIGGVRQKVHFFCLDLPQSDACFVKAYPRETTEAFLDGHVGLRLLRRGAAVDPVRQSQAGGGQGSAGTARASGRGPSPAWSATTCSRTALVARARATTRARWRVW